VLDSIRPDLVDHGGAVDVSSCDAERARALMTLGRLDEARQAAERSLVGLGDMPRLESAHTRLLLGRVLGEQGNLDACVEQTTLAAATLEAMGASRRAAAAWRELGDLYRDLGHVEPAIDAYDRALRAVRVAPAAVVRPAADSPRLGGDARQEQVTTR
jgi:tetratricopeptide (TPR) repeat protein